MLVPSRNHQNPPERNTLPNMRSILDAIRGYVPFFAPGRQLAKSALHQLTDGWKGPGSPGLNQGQHPALTSTPCEAELAPNPEHPPTSPGGPRLPVHRQPPMESDHTSVWSPDSHHLPQQPRRHDMRALMEQPDTEYHRAHNGSDATAQVPGEPRESSSMRHSIA